MWKKVEVDGIGEDVEANTVTRLYTCPNGVWRESEPDIMSGSVSISNFFF